MPICYALKPDGQRPSRNFQMTLSSSDKHKQEQDTCVRDGWVFSFRVFVCVGAVFRSLTLDYSRIKQCDLLLLVNFLMDFPLICIGAYFFSRDAN